VFGIPSYLEPQNAAILQDVLGQIRQRWPNDFLRLQKIVHKIVPLSSSEENARWQKLEPRDDEPQTWAWGFDDTPGVIYLDESVPLDVASIVILLGSACASRMNVRRRGKIDKEWAERLAAISFAYKWGFGRVIARARKSNAGDRYGPRPRSTIDFGSNGKQKFFRITRRFCVHASRLLHHVEGTGRILSIPAAQRSVNRPAKEGSQGANSVPRYSPCKDSVRIPLVSRKPPVGARKPRDDEPARERLGHGCGSEAP
jgi:hypothetical protein